MRSLVVIISVVFSLQSSAQDFMLNGTVRDAETSEELEGCHVMIEGSNYATITDQQGRFSLLLDSSLWTGLTLLTQRLGYETDSKSVDASQVTYTGQGISVTVSMTTKAYDLDAIPISSERIPDVVYSSRQHSIADYEFLGDELLLLAYEKRLEKASMLYLIDAEGITRDSLDVPEKVKATGLKRDYADLVYLEAVGRIYQVEVDGNGLSMNQVDMQVYEEQVAPVVDTIGAQVFFSTWMDQFPAFDYYRYDLIDSQYTHIRQVADAFMLELCRAEFRYLTMRDKLRMYRLELETGIEKEVLTCMSTFRDGLYYDPIYAPMFVKGDSLLLFDHPSEELFIFDTQGVALDSLPIQYHQPKKVMGNEFTQELVMDEVTGDVYAIFQRQGGTCRLHRIDLATGKAEETLSLVYDYPTSIQIRDDEVYYTYRPFESSQKKYLYKELIVVR